jgi:hypothetical protein
MWHLLELIEESGFATWVRETPSVFGYSTVLALHTFGMAFLVGLSGAIAARVLGIAPSLPIGPLEEFFPLIIAGFWVNAVTGVVLTTLAARSLLSNPDFYIKLVAIVGAIVCLRRLRTYAFGGGSGPGSDPSTGKAWARAMLACWAVAILAGRLTAYTNFVRTRTAIAVGVAIVALFAIRYVVLLATGGYQLSPSGKPSSHTRVPASTN